MKILLATGASWEPPRGGSTRANRVWLEYLAAQGHECHVVCPGPATDLIESARVQVHRTADTAALEGKLLSLIRLLAPDRVLVSTEDAGQKLLLAALSEAGGKVVWLAHTPQMFPFGPASLHPNSAGADAVWRVHRIVAIGRWAADYIEAHTGRRAAIVHPPLYGPGPWQPTAHFGRGAVGLINPCAVKGLSIFLGLADRFPDLRFAALRGWGTTSADLAELRARPNVDVVEPVADIDEFFSRLQVLVVPSLWPEGFGLVVVEAMLRGIPVLAADHGGLVEAKAGVPYLLPVQPIERYTTAFDELRLPLPELPAQNREPWAAALSEITASRALYERVSRQSHAAAVRLVSGIDPADFERAITGSMDVLLVQNSQYFPAFGGGNKSNRLLMEALAACGHRCTVATRVDDGENRSRLTAELESRAVAYQADADTVRFRLTGVEVITELDPARVRDRWSEEIRTRRPRWVLVSSDDPAQLFLEQALEASRGRVVYLCRTTLALPFGPDAALLSEVKTEMLRRCAAVVGVSEYVAEYIRRWSGIDAVHLPISMQGSGPFPRLGNFEAGYVTMVNPCAIKGLPIFLAMARACPEFAFAAVPTWGTTAADLAALRALPNMTVLEPQDDIDRILEKSRVVVVPSLWAEARSRMVIESLLRGVPVLAADVGGIPEAMLGLPGLLPVRRIEHYRPELDEQLVPVPDVPEQDAAPWIAALRDLLGARERYEALSEESRRRAHAWLADAGIERFERFLGELRPRHAGPETPRRAPGAGALAALSPEKRALLAARLRQRRIAQAPAVHAAPPRIPLSYAQEAMLRVHERDPDHCVWNVPVVLATGLSREAAAQRLRSLVERHEVLRTSFSSSGQRIHAAAEVRVAAEPPDFREPFDLERPPLLRASLTDGRLILVVHHLIADGWSAAILHDELNGAERPVSMPYREWVLWQRRQVEAAAWQAQRERLGRLLPQSPPADRLRTFRGARLLAEADGLAGFERCLRVWSETLGQPVAAAVANRRLTAVENTVGLFTNNVPVVAGDAASALANSDYPAELLPYRPVHLFVYQNAAPAPADDVDTGKSAYETRLSVAPAGGRMRVRLQYSTEVMDEASARLLLSAYVQRLAGRKR